MTKEEMIATAHKYGLVGEVLRVYNDGDISCEEALSSLDIL